MNNSIHIVCHEVPWPASHGGLIDIFYKIVWLHKTGFKIKLHCYTTQKKTAPELEQYCESVQYYPRKTGAKSISARLPYIVKSRNSTVLLQNLLEDDNPIIFEGMHSTAVLLNNALEKRKVFVRLFNVEYNYYHSLAKAETNFFKKLYFKTEARRLKKYEKKIAAMAECWALSTIDAAYYTQIYAAKKVVFIPAFTAHNYVESLPGKGNYCLYHGNLEISENKKAVSFLITEVFAGTDFNLIVAGKNPGKELLKLKEKNIKIIANPSDTELNQLIKNAQVNVLPSWNNTGVKLKLLNAMFLGRYCLVNAAGVAGSGLSDLCRIAKTAQEFKIAMAKLMNQEFARPDIKERKNILENLYNNERNAALISEQVR